jgi:hypothetical protein
MLEANVADDIDKYFRVEILKRTVRYHTYKTFNALH